MLPWMTIERNIMLPLKIVPPFRQGYRSKRKGEYRDRVEALLAQAARREVVPFAQVRVADGAPVGCTRYMPIIEWAGRGVPDEVEIGGRAVQEAVWNSLRRAFVGFAVSVVIGTALGLLLAQFRFVRTAIGPLVSGLQSLPSVAWVPAAIIWFGLTDAAIYMVVLLGAVPSIATTISVPAPFSRWSLAFSSLSEAISLSFSSFASSTAAMYSRAPTRTPRTAREINNRLNEIAVQAGLPVKNLAFIKLENGEYKSPLWKIFTDSEKANVVSKLDLAEIGTLTFESMPGKTCFTVLLPVAEGPEHAVQGQAS